jgi:hypothetical protein
LGFIIRRGTRPHKYTHEQNANSHCERSSSCPTIRHGDSIAGEKGRKLFLARRHPAPIHWCGRIIAQADGVSIFGRLRVALHSPIPPTRVSQPAAVRRGTGRRALRTTDSAGTTTQTLQSSSLDRISPTKREGRLSVRFFRFKSINRDHRQSRYAAGTLARSFLRLQCFNRTRFSSKRRPCDEPRCRCGLSSPRERQSNLPPARTSAPCAPVRTRIHFSLLSVPATTPRNSPSHSPRTQSKSKLTTLRLLCRVDLFFYFF